MAPDDSDQSKTGRLVAVTLDEASIGIYWCTLAAGCVLFFWLWVIYPRRLYRDRDDADNLRGRAIRAVR